MPLSERSKKLFLTVLFLAVVAGIGVAMYVVFFRATPEAVEPGAPEPAASGALPGAGRAKPPGAATSTGASALPNGGTGAIGATNGSKPAAPQQPSRTSVLVRSESRFVAASGAAKNALRFYNPADGKFYRTDEFGDIDPLSDRAFYNVQNVSWGNGTDKAILEFPDGSNVFFDFRENRQITLPKHWEDFTFSASDDRIVAKSMGNNESNRFLVVANPDGSEARAVQELGDNGDKVKTVWTPNNQVIAYAHTGDPIGFDREQVILVGQNHENFEGLVTEGRGFIPSWSPQGKALAYSVYTSANGYIPELWVSGGTADAINSGRRRLSLNTWADKCAWSSESLLFCAVPESLEAGAGLQREAAVKGPDQIFRVDLKSGQKTNLGRVDGVADIRSLTVSTDGETAFLVDQTTGRLVRYDLAR